MGSLLYCASFPCSSFSVVLPLRNTSRRSLLLFVESFLSTQSERSLTSCFPYESQLKSLDTTQCTLRIAPTSKKVHTRRGSAGTQIYISPNFKSLRTRPSVQTSQCAPNMLTSTSAYMLWPALLSSTAKGSFKAWLATHRIFNRHLNACASHVRNGRESYCGGNGGKQRRGNCWRVKRMMKMTPVFCSSL